MILDSTKTAKNIFIGDTKNEKYKILANSKMFAILSSKLYTDKIMAPIRELICNAYDAHVAAGVADKPIEIGVPSAGSGKFRVRDFGKGLSPEDMLELYTTYGASTKNLSNDFIGCMGLGSKSPFAYTDTFTAVSRHKGMRYSFSCSLDNGAPNITQYPSVPMELGEETGLEVEFPVNAGDYNSFQNKLKYFALFFCGKLKFIIEPGMRESYSYDWSTPTKANLEYVHDVAISDEVSTRGLHVLMGGVLYDCNTPEFSPKNFPLTRDQFSAVVHALTNCGTPGFVIKGKLGCVDIAASREHCELTAKTVNFVLTMLHNYLDHVEKASRICRSGKHLSERSSIRRRRSRSVL